ncbi:MAG: hypothetical protein A3G75_14495 [Verrucomicrobia bacterium RIFCSPLOWO2_12_FULL_64_8]|nr:MAG: hypothetical protein A3G75_14495 [Verrucomicrobia bacterium RIFCSPLOWO2_12_FULL_64_8]
MASSEMMARLEKELAPSAPVQLPGRRFLPGMIGWVRVGWPVAATFALFAALAVAHRYFANSREASLEKPQVPVSGAEVTHAPVFKPVRAGNLHYASLDEGFVWLADGLPARRVLDRYIDTFEWRDSRTNASVEWKIPREEIRIIPVSAY